MTLAELERLLDSKRRVLRQEQQQRAAFDYTLADLIGRSVARVYNSGNKLPDISEAYPSLFDSQEVQERKEQQRAELSALRFRLFAQAHNQRMKEVQYGQEPEGDNQRRGD